VLALHPTLVAPLLLGAHLTSVIDGTRVVLRITEVEAYGGVGEDPGSHAFRRQTSRNTSMFGRPGLLYVYFTYGMHFCANVVTGPPGEASAVLLRAGEILRGLPRARSRRPTASVDRDLARGPARLTLALGIAGDADGLDLLSRTSPVRLSLQEAVDPALVRVSTRTGVAGAGAPTPWRFFLVDEPTVSAHRPVRT
jgi:DNA-3-methyladenine glycosylase